MQLDRVKAWRMAAHFDAMPAYDHGYGCEAAYREMMHDLTHQFWWCRDRLGIYFEAWEDEGEPYANSKEMRRDVAENKHLYFLKTDVAKTFGTLEQTTRHPLLEPFNDLCYNDLLRIVHDILGHCKADSGFGPIGEEKAWQEHRKWFSALALPAITNETRLQNSWVNFGPYSYLPVRERPFATQKVGLAPAWACEI